MVPEKKDFLMMFGENDSCLRPVGGNCVGNCRKIDDYDCMRPVGGNCVGNCRKCDKR